MQVLSPQLLDMLAEQLPKLKQLKVKFTDLRGRDGTDVPTETGEGSSRAVSYLTELMDEALVQFCPISIWLSNLIFPFLWIS